MVVREKQVWVIIIAILPSPERIYTNEILVCKLRLCLASSICPLNLELIDCPVTSHNCTITNPLCSLPSPPSTAHSGFVCVRQVYSVNKLLYQ